MSKSIFMDALKRKRQGRRACGSATSMVTADMMEASGASFPEAHLNPEKMAALAELGHTKLGFDNVMPLFSVCHETAALGGEVDWGDPRKMPSCGAPLAGSVMEDFKIPSGFLLSEHCQTPLKALALLKRRLGEDAAVTGKIFGPWTLAYHIYGLEEFLMASLLEPGRVKAILRNLLKVSLAFGKAQIEAGADALCLADHCTRDLCSPAAYRDFLLEIHQELAAGLPCPLMLHICGDTSDRMPFIAETGIACFHFDSKSKASEARRLSGERIALMGGTGNIEVVRSGSPERIAADVEEKLGLGIDIIGPECAVPLDAPSENLRLLVAEVKRRASN